MSFLKNKMNLLQCKNVSMISKNNIIKNKYLWWNKWKWQYNN